MDPFILLNIAYTVLITILGHMICSRHYRKYKKLAEMNEGYQQTLRERLAMADKQFEEMDLHLTFQREHTRFIKMQSSLAKIKEKKTRSPFQITINNGDNS